MGCRWRYLVFADPAQPTAASPAGKQTRWSSYFQADRGWRNAYLTGAEEEGGCATADSVGTRATGDSDIQRAMAALHDAGLPGHLLDANAAENLNLTINLAFLRRRPLPSDRALESVGGNTERRETRGRPSFCSTQRSDAAACSPFSTAAADTHAAASIIDRGRGIRAIITKLTEHLTAFDFFFNIVEPWKVPARKKPRVNVRADGHQGTPTRVSFGFGYSTY